MGLLDQAVPPAGPLTAAQLTDEINTELAELFRRSFVKVTGAAGTNNYTAAIPLNRPLQDGNGFIMEVPNSNTGASNFNGKPLVTAEAAALQSGQLVTGQTILFTYDQSSDHYRLVAVNSTGAGSAPIVTVYTNSATWTKPAGLRYVRVRVQAGGGGGGGVTTGSTVGQGGGAGSYGERIIAATAIGATVNVTVGGGGAGGAVGTNPGANGGASSFGAFVTTNGGNGGGTSGGDPGDAVAAGSGGDLNIGGQSGRAGLGVGAGSGGDSMLGRGGTTILPGRRDGAPGIGYGAGGSGGFGTGAGGSLGGAGASGVVVVEEYYA
jgi:hypothetical protein